MTLKVEHLGESTAVTLQGALTIGRPVEDLRTAVSSLLKQGVRWIRLNVRGVPYADASGLGVLVACRAQAHASGGSLTVEGATGKLRELMVLTRLGALRRGGPRSVRPVRPPRRRVVFSISMLAPKVA